MSCHWDELVIVNGTNNAAVGLAAMPGKPGDMLYHNRDGTSFTPEPTPTSFEIYRWDDGWQSAGWYPDPTKPPKDES